MSRLRRLLGGLGVSIARRGAGYALDLGGATLDAKDFSTLAEHAAQAEAEEAHELAAHLAAEALGLWRGPLLADIVLGSVAAAEAERLAELRLRTLELRFDAELALGRDTELVAELRAVVGEHPYRERFVAQLMLALYRAGRHAEALEVYERTRRALADDLGLQPSADLQQLSAQIVRPATAASKTVALGSDIRQHIADTRRRQQAATQ